MRLLVFSDLHLEHRPPWSLPSAFPPYDVAVVAGDMGGSVRNAVRILTEHSALRTKPVLFVPGNHEFYGGELDWDLADGMKAAAGTNVAVLHRRTIVLGGVRFIGATLWSDYALDATPERSMRHAGAGLNDHRLIKVRRADGTVTPFTPEDALAQHRQDRAFLERELGTPFAGPTVVLTHHLPHPTSIAPADLGNPLNPAFASDLGELIERISPELWIHGHTHCSVDTQVGNTRVLCNPKGYGPSRAHPATENPAFTPDLVVVVGSASS